MKTNQNSLAFFISRHNNNYDFIRLIAATLVIYGHANAMIPQHLHGGDFVYSLLGFEYSGSLAVKTFFFLSGLVVTNSLLEKQSIQHFVVARFFRIWPALLFVLFFSSLFIGSIYTSLDINSYLTHAGTYQYILKNSLMDITYELPFVFHTHPEAPFNHRVINGSLWSLPYELACYIFLVTIFILGAHKSKALSILLAILFLADTLSGNSIIYSWRPTNPTIDDLGPVFAMGALAAVLKDKIPINIKTTVALLLIYFLFKKSPHVKYIFYIAFFYFLLYAFSRPIALKVKLNFDISYGIYIWGWPIQQILAHSLPNLSFYSHISIAIITAGVAAIFSWFIIEKPCISYGQRLNNKITEARHKTKKILH